MEKEWFKWKKGTGAEEHVDYDETWYDGDWVQDWSQPSEAWDRYATLDGAVSKHTLKNQPKEQEPSEKPEEKTIPKKQPRKPAAKDTAAAVSKHDTEQDKHQNKTKVEGDDCECTTPDDTKGQVNSIAKYLRVIKGAGWKVKRHEDLTDDIKREFKKDFPTTEECRYNIYWKLASVGVHLKSEKKDLVTYSVHSDAGPYLLRLHSCLKAAGLFATRNEFQWCVVTGYLHESAWPIPHMLSNIPGWRNVFVFDFKILFPLLSLSLAEVNYVEAKSRQPRDKGDHLSEDSDILTLKDSLKCSVSKALKRVCKWFLLMKDSNIAQYVAVSVSE